MLATVLVTRVYEVKKKFDGDYNRWRKLNLILQEVQKHYVDTIDMKGMTDAAVVAALAELDPHSVYLPPVELTESETELAGNFDGIGIQFNVPNDTTPTNTTRSQVTINLDTSKLDDFHVYSWDLFMFTGDDKLVHNSENTADSYELDYCEVVFGKTPILWANQDEFNTTPNFQPNKMYCIEFVKAFDGVLIARIKYYVSLVKKS